MTLNGWSKAAIPGLSRNQVLKIDESFWTLNLVKQDLTGNSVGLISPFDIGIAYSGIAPLLKIDDLRSTQLKLLRSWKTITVNSIGTIQDLLEVGYRHSIDGGLTFVEVPIFTTITTNIQTIDISALTVNGSNDVIEITVRQTSLSGTTAPPRIDNIIVSYNIETSISSLSFENTQTKTIINNLSFGLNNTKQVSISSKPQEFNVGVLVGNVLTGLNSAPPSFVINGNDLVEKLGSASSFFTFKKVFPIKLKAFSFGLLQKQTQLNNLTFELPVSPISISSLSIGLSSAKQTAINSKPQEFNIGSLVGNNHTGLTSSPREFNIGPLVGNILTGNNSSSSRFITDGGDLVEIFGPISSLSQFKTILTPGLLGFSITSSELQNIILSPNLGWSSISDMLNITKNPLANSFVLIDSQSITTTQPINYDPNIKSLSNMIFFIEDSVDNIFKYFQLNSSFVSQLTGNNSEYLWINSDKPNTIHKFILILHPGGDIV